MVKNITIGAEGLGSIPRPAKSNTMSLSARQRCDVSSKMCPRALRREDEPVNR